MIQLQQEKDLVLSDCNILIVDDEPLNAMVLEHILSDDFKVNVVFSGEEALQYCLQKNPDLILLDIVMDGMSGLDVCKKIKEDAQLCHIPIIFVTSIKSEADQNMCWEAGGVDFVEKPVNGVTLLNRVKVHLTIKLQTDLLRKMSLINELTGLYNRHLISDDLSKSVLQVNRSGSSLSVLMIDIDWFKQFNDTYGHLEGDKCLKCVAKEIQLTLNRPMDMAIRFGGEEFLCILPYTDTSGALHLAKTILNGLVKLSIPHENSPLKIVTVSIGLHSIDAGTKMTPHDLIQHADDALYKAKQQGRNQCTISSI